MKYRLKKKLSFAAVGSVWEKVGKESSFYRMKGSPEDKNLWILKELVEQTDFFEPIEEEGYVLALEEIELGPVDPLLLGGYVYRYESNTVFLDSGTYTLEPEDWKRLQKVELKFLD